LENADGKQCAKNCLLNRYEKTLLKGKGAVVKKALCLRGKGIVLALVIFGFTDCALAVSGNDWKTIPVSAQEAYIMAVVDTWRNAAYMCRETSYSDKQNPASKTFNCEFFDRMNRPLESCFKNSPTVSKSRL
jgi:hypothetical protein